eukprot:gnl/TRDRNA2_/TRDRNA2_28271_c0_seq1.p1 gnl/TRDRNA2_/TRDRNA2_28271_c0~~gnl/TRDRNA2_/TRDRNA2_28271_c0_seq1.p1  ORF type:complete len:285 (+),score=39.83 gnl/TRDRNA2_/TRDRNA2_28271_c0_seq1:49-903(+)
MPELPYSIGIIGVGTIGSAIAQGLCRSGLDGTSIVLSHRSSVRSAALAAKYAGSVWVANSNQQVLDRCSCVILAVLPSQAVAVLSALAFREDQKVISLIAGSSLNLSRLGGLIAPATDCTRVSALPAVASRRGASIGVPPGKPHVDAIFGILGSYLAAKDEAQFNTLTCIMSFMGDFYKRQLAMQQWLVSRGIAAADAAAVVSGAMETFIAGSAGAGPDTFAALVTEQTAGGINEMVWKQQDADGVYEALNYSLDCIYQRKTTGVVDAQLEPAARRHDRMKARL